jgi:4-hydroxythreonine-4-phosphate dehydrogenase
MGDPAGVGPEIAVKALCYSDVHAHARPLIVGDAGILRKAIGVSGTTCKVRVISEVGQAVFSKGIIDVLDLKNVDLDKLQYCKVSAAAGRAAFEALRKVIALAMSGEVDATVTGPVSKTALNLAGHKFPGHTEIYAHYTGVKDYAMMMIVGSFRVSHVTTHMPLREACDGVKKDRILRVIELTWDACVRFGVKSPRIGVAGLNPHAGEEGLFGTEEREEIRPAIEAARKAGMDVEGPVPGDSLFPKARGGWYDAAVAMYHDQGHIPVKMVGFTWSKRKKRWESVSGVNLTLGLPIIRTSVDHGTAFDSAWKGIAVEKSMVDAMEVAYRLAARKG